MSQFGGRGRNRAARGRAAVAALAAASLAAPAGGQPLPTPPAAAPEGVGPDLALGALDHRSAPRPREARIRPFVELRQVVDVASLVGPREFRTYSELGAGFNASVSREHLAGQLDYQLGYRAAEAGEVEDEVRHSLLGRGELDLLPDRLEVEAGAFAALLNRDYRGRVSLNPDELNPNLTQTYSGFIEPSVRQELGSVGLVTASYRLGYADVDERERGSAGTADDGGLDLVSDSANQTATVSLGNDPRSRRLRWALTGSWTEERQDRLEQRFRSYLGKLDLEYALGRTLSLVGSIGYEDIENDEQDLLRDPFGLPVVGPDGDFVPDELGPRRPVYLQSGAIWDVGVRLTPSRRTVLLVRGGRRFDDFSMTGELRFEPKPNITVTGFLTDGVESFGRLLTQQIDGVPYSYEVRGGDPFGFGGCVYGFDRATFQCIGGATQSITSATFRSRNAALGVQAEGRRDRVAVTLTWNDRRYLDAQQLATPTAPLDPTLEHRHDRTLGLTGTWWHDLRARQALNASVYAYRYQLALSSGRRDWYAGGQVGYDIRLDRRFSARATTDLYRRFSNIGPSYTEVMLAVAARYTF